MSAFAWPGPLPLALDPLDPWRKQLFGTRSGMEGAPVAESEAGGREATGTSRELVQSNCHLQLLTLFVLKY
jgi:hypothetical protein